MDEIVTELTKPVWWVSVVIAGIVINLLSAYIKNSLDQIPARASAWLRNRSVARKTIWLKKIKLLRSSQEARQLATATEVRIRLQAIQLFLLSIFILLFHSVASTTVGDLPRLFVLSLLAFSTITFFFAFLAFREAAELAALLRSAEGQSIF